MNLEDDDKLRLWPNEICAYREIFHEGKTIPQVLVQWEGQVLKDAVWVDLQEFKAKFPNFYLEDKVNFEG